MHGGSYGLPGWGGAAANKVAVTAPGMPFGEQTATHLSRVGRRADSARGFPPSGRGPRQDAGALFFPKTTGVRRRQAPAGAGEPEAARAGARDSAGLSLPCCRQSQPCSRPPPAPGSREPPGYRSCRGGGAWLRRPRPSAAVPAPGPPRLCGAERSWAERGARCSLAFRKATLAAGRRDAGLTHARARVNARLPGCVRGSDGGHRRRGGQGAGSREQERGCRKEPLETRRLSSWHLLSGKWSAMAKGLLSWGPHLSLQTHLLLTLSGFQSHIVVILLIPMWMLPRFLPLAALSPGNLPAYQSTRPTPTQLSFPEP